MRPRPQRPRFLTLLKPSPKTKHWRRGKKLAVVAIGGNSLVKDNAHQAMPHQWQAVRETTKHIVAMIENGWDVVVTHGNGPQLGFTALRAELAQEVLHPLTLDICGAEVQGLMGYMIQQALQEELWRQNIKREVITVVTQVLVDGNDQAFQHPTKPIGPFYIEEQARELEAISGWEMREDSGRGWRRVVPSPRPQEIVEVASIQAMIEAGAIVIAAGGGGIPVVRDAEGHLRGVGAAVDKDLTGSLLASTLHADLLLISTAVEKVALNYRQANQRNLDVVKVSEACEYLSQGHFAPGSMEPKIQAALEYLARGGKSALITMPQSIGRALARETGTWIIPDEAELQVQNQVVTQAEALLPMFAEPIANEWLGA